MKAIYTSIDTSPITADIKLNILYREISYARWHSITPCLSVARNIVTLDKNSNRGYQHSFLPGLLDTLVSSIQRSLALGLFHKFLLRFRICDNPNQSATTRITIEPQQRNKTYRPSASP